MSDESNIKLKKSSVINAPFNMYEKNFTFIVNGQEYKTSRFIADLLSPKISELHSIDPTSDNFIISTQESGDFSIFLNLINFHQNNILESDLPFISEVIKILNTNTIEVYIPENHYTLTIDNVFEKLENHEKNEKFFSKEIEAEIEFITSHFFEIDEEDDNKIEQLSNIKLTTLNSILNSEKLLLKTEDQLLKIINSIYSIKRSYFQLYEHIQFVNVDSENILEFLGIFNFEDMTNETWHALSIRLEQDIRKTEKLNTRYKFDKNDIKSLKNNSNKIEIKFNEMNHFDGIINFIRKTTADNFSSSLNVTASSVGNSFFSPSNIIDYESNQLYFYTKNVQNSWVRIDFKENRVCPSSYSLRSDVSSDYHPKSWVIEGSNDKVNWEKIDQKNNCNAINGRDLIHNFQIQNNNGKEFRYIQMRITGKNWLGNNLLDIGAIEFHGTLILH